MKIVNVILGIVGILIALAVWWSNRSTESANEFIDEGNAIIERGNEHGKAAHDKLQAVEAMDFSKQATEIRKLATDGAELYGKSRDCFLESAAKFQAAQEAVLDTTLKEYFGLEHKANTKLAQLQDSFVKHLQIYADPTISDVDTLNQKTKVSIEQMTAISNEFETLKAAAAKFAAEHRDKLPKQN